LRHVALIVEMPAKDTATITRSLRQDERALHRAGCWTQKKPEVVVSERWRRFSGAVCKM
jgi:hypothetical protein